MTDWPVKALGEVALVNPSEPALSEEAPFVPMDAVTAGKRDVQYTQPRGQRSGARACAGDILFARITPCLQNGKVALVQDEIARCGGSTEFIVVRAGPEVLNGYLYQWITSDHIRDEMTALMKGATGRQRLNAEDLALAEIPVPPLEEQNRIVALLDAATARVTEITACYEKARAHANDLFASALRDAVESNPDWPVKTLGEVATFHNGRAYKQQELLDKGKYRVLRVGNFFSSKSWYWSDLELDEHKYCDKGDLLYAWSASFGPRIWDEEKVIYHYHIWKVVEDSQQIDRQFLKYWLEEDVERVKSASGTGTTMMHVSKGNIEARLISLPPLEEQNQIVARLDSMRAKTSEMVAAYDAKLTAAKNLRQSILEAAFAGDL